MFERNCPRCKKKISYTTVSVRNRKERKQQLCKSCALTQYFNSIDRSGKKNAFFGRHHSKKTRETISAKALGRPHPVDKNKGMHGRSVYDVWLKKYGKTEADLRRKCLNNKLSNCFSGKNNPMYGKPSPTKSGNGWSGWYKGWYFRSIRELSYVINVLERKHLSWTGGEKIRIPYIDKQGNDRTYTPDFLVETKMLIEIKPKRLKRLPENLAKKQAAIKYCKKHNLIYKMIDVRRNKLTIDQTIDLYKNRLITLTEKYRKKIEQIIQKRKDDIRKN